MKKILSLALVAVLSLGLAAPVFAGGRGGGFQYCHVSAMPKKDSFKPEDLDPRGKWLLAEKDKTKSPDVKADWLKNYPGGD